jgi:hypothetical protein
MMTMSQLDNYTIRSIRLAYQPPTSSTFLLEQINHQQSAHNTFLSEQISTSHQPPAKQTGYYRKNAHLYWSMTLICTRY